MPKIAFVLPVALMISACSSNAEPTGQVAATVDGKEITVSEMTAELDGLSSTDPKQQQALMQAALQNIVTRTLLAKEADAQGLTNSPAAALLLKRAEQTVAMELLSRKFRQNVPKISDEEVEDFVAGNSNMFSQRKIWLVEQISVPNPPPTLIKDLEPLDTMAEVQAALQQKQLSTNLSFGVLDALTLQPEAVRQINALAPNEVFILPDNNGLRINRIKETQTLALSPKDAAMVARDMLLTARTNQLVDDQVRKVLAAGQSKVKYNAGYKPKAAPKAGPAPANKE